MSTFMPGGSAICEKRFGSGDLSLSSAVISGHPRSSAVIRGHQRSSEVITCALSDTPLSRASRGAMPPCSRIECWMATLAARERSGPGQSSMARVSMQFTWNTRGHHRASGVISWPFERGEGEHGIRGVISGHQGSSWVITWPEQLGEGVGSRLLRLASLEHLKQEWDGARGVHGRLRLHIRRRDVRHAVRR